MNLSGESIGALATFFKIKPEEILVIHDELELAPGTVSLKWSGGLGGHNGGRCIFEAVCIFVVCVKHDLKGVLCARSSLE